MASPVDHRADIYAFGLMLYDMLLGRRHAGAQSAVTDLMSRMQHAPASPRSLDPHIPEAVDRIVVQCLQPDPSARHQTTAELLQELERLSPDGHETVPSTGRATAVSGVSITPPRRASRHRLLAAGVALLLLLALAVLVAVPATRHALLKWMPGAERPPASLPRANRRSWPCFHSASWVIGQRSSTSQTGYRSRCRPSSFNSRT